MSKSLKYRELEEWLAAEIYRGRWQMGERLPSIRALAQELALSKATVIHALNRLEMRGLLLARPKAGYFVADVASGLNLPTTQCFTQAPRLVSVDDVLSDIMQRSAAFDLAPGENSGDAMQGIRALHRSLGRAQRQLRGDESQYYDEPAGDAGLRHELVQWYRRRGTLLNAQQLCITSGCQHALFLALMAVCQAGDVIAVESPGYFGVLQLADQLRLKVVEVPSSSVIGMDMGALESALRQWNVKACVVAPAYATPSGALMPAESRRTLLELAGHWDVTVIEDDIYADLGFEGAPDSLKSMDSDNRVILCSSFSKSLSRDLRLGWIAGGRWHKRIQRLKLVTQLSSSRSLQQGVAGFLADGGYLAHLRRQRIALRQRSRQLLNELQQWPLPVRASQPEGGLAIWVELPAYIDTLRGYQRLLQRGVVLTPGPLFSASGKFGHCLRISFAHAWTKHRLQALRQIPPVLADSSTLV